MVSFNILSLSTELLLVGQSANRDKSQDAESKATNSAEPQDTDSVKERGVYIQDVKGKLWEGEEWDGSVVPNAIAVIAKEAKFLIALAQSVLQVSDSGKTEFDRYMFSTSCHELALTDNDGAGNTARMLNAQPNVMCAAGYCNAFMFPNKKTKGYLPSLGQLYIAYKNKAKIDAAIGKCGGAAMSTSYYYWSSTFWGIDTDAYRGFWKLQWNNRSVYSSNLFSKYYVRPFANFN